MAAGAACALAPGFAGTESFFSSSVEPQPGQSGAVPLRTSVSNSCPHFLHPYSKIGIRVYVYEASLARILAQARRAQRPGCQPPPIARTSAIAAARRRPWMPIAFLCSLRSAVSTVTTFR